MLNIINILKCIYDKKIENKCFLINIYDEPYYLNTYSDMITITDEEDKLNMFFSVPLTSHPMIEVTDGWNRIENINMFTNEYDIVVEDDELFTDIFTITSTGDSFEKLLLIPEKFIHPYNIFSDILEQRNKIDYNYMFEFSTNVMNKFDMFNDELLLVSCNDKK